jgi:hypothetical protein
MPSLSPDELNLEPSKILFWNFSELDIALAPQEQTANLTEDLAQVGLAHGVLLDIGWYPALRPDGEFVVLVVREGEWETPVARFTASTWDGLRSAVSKAVVTAKVSELDRHKR